MWRRRSSKCFREPQFQMPVLLVNFSFQSSSTLESYSGCLPTLSCHSGVSRTLFVVSFSGGCPSVSHVFRLQQRSSIYISVLEGILQTPRGLSQPFWLPPPLQWSEKEGQPGYGNCTLAYHHSEPVQSVPSSSLGGIRTAR